MKKLVVYDPPLCCPTGVCGPSVDPKLVRFAADLDWLKKKGVVVERFNLAQQPGAFARNEIVRAELAARGNGCLPLIIVDGNMASRGGYPGRQQLAELAGIEYEAGQEGAVGPGAGLILPMAEAGGGCCPAPPAANDIAAAGQCCRRPGQDQDGGCC